MKLRFQFGAVLAACLAAGLMCGSAYGQRLNATAQNEGAPPRLAQRPRLRPRLPNALPPKGNPSNLPPKAWIERPQDMPPRRQEQFLREQPALPESATGTAGAASPAPRSLEPPDSRPTAGLARPATRLGANDSRAAEKRPPVAASSTGTTGSRCGVRPLLWCLHSLRNTSEAERQAKLNDPAFVEGLNPEDREMLGQLAHLHVGMAPDSPGM